MNAEPTEAEYEEIEAKLELAAFILGADSEKYSDLRERLWSIRYFEWPPDGQQLLSTIEVEIEDALNTLEGEETWPEPEPLLQGETAPPLTSDLLPPKLREWIVDAADRRSVPLELVAIPAIVSLGAAAGRSVALYPKRYDNWHVVPNLWGVVVAPSSSLKTPALEEGTRPLSRIAAQVAASHAEERHSREADAMLLQARLEKLNKDARSTSPPASLAADIADTRRKLEELQQPSRRYITSDSTVEMLAEILMNNPRGLLIKRDEIVGLLDSYNKPGREGDREFYLEGFNSAENYTVDRIGRGTLHVPALTLSIIGGIQPGKMETFVLGAVGGRREADGLLQRFQLAVYPERPTYYTHVDKPIDQTVYDKAYAFYQLFTEFEPVNHPELEFPPDSPPGLRFTDEAQGVFNGWITTHMTRLRSGELDATPAFQAHLGKFQSLVAKLALLFHLLETIESGVVTPVNLESLNLAIVWTEYLEAHARKLYTAEFSRVPPGALELAGRIEADEIADGSTLRDIYRKGWKHLKNAKEVATAAQFLSNRHWLRIEKASSTGTGRPGEVIRLNPRLGTSGS